MELTNYNIKFVHIKGKNNVLADAISRLKTLNIYKEPLENPKTPVFSNTNGHVMEMCATHMHITSITMLSNEKKWDLTSQLHHSNKSSLKSVIMSANGVLQKQQYIHGLKHDVTIVPHSLVPTFLHEFHDSKSHQGAIHTFEVIKRSY